MATHKSAIKRIRQSEKRKLRNKASLSTMRTLIKKFHTAIEAKDSEGAKKSLVAVVPFVDKTAGKGVIHKNQASRIVSRLTKKLTQLSAAADVPAPEVKKATRAKKAVSKTAKTTKTAKKK